MSDGQKEGVPPRRVGPCFGAFCMSDLSFFDPPIEIAAGGARQDMIMSRLKASGLRLDELGEVLAAGLDARRRQQSQGGQGQRPQADRQAGLPSPAHAGCLTSC